MCHKPRIFHPSVVVQNQTEHRAGAGIQRLPSKPYERLNHSLTVGKKKKRKLHSSTNLSDRHLCCLTALAGISCLYHPDCTKEAGAQPDTLTPRSPWHYAFLTAFPCLYKMWVWVIGKILQTAASSSLYQACAGHSVTAWAPWSFFYPIPCEAITSSWVWFAELGTS